jgi:pSer/pThr/pTyr-binding forkhead associated (FHA) protein
MRREIKVIIKSGPKEGLEYILKNILTLGRDENNDIVINDDTVSRFHAKIFMEEDVPVIVDLESINSTFVNDQEINHIQLRDKDEVAIGNIKLQIKIKKIEDVWLEEKEKEGKEELSEDNDTETKNASVSQKKNISSQTAVILFLIIVIIGFAIWLIPKIRTDGGKDDSGPAANTKYEIRYIKGEATNQNIYRYEFIVKPYKDKYRIIAYIDDIIQGKHIDESAFVNKEDVKSLMEEIPKRDFFQLKRKYSVPDPERYFFVSIDLTIGKNTRRVKVINIEPPHVFNAIQEVLEDFAERKMNLITITLPGEELRDKANKDYLLAKKFYNTWQVNPPNLYNSILLCRKALMYLDYITPKPNIYKQIKGLLEDAEKDLKEEYNKVMLRVDINIKQRQWEAAEEDLKYLLMLIPERSDPRYKKAERKMGLVQNKLNRRKRY